MSRVIGIDLGTTNSCVAIMDGEDAVVIPSPEGARTTPSVVAFTQSGERLVGSIAKRQAVTNAASTVFAVKRLMGRKASDENVEDMAASTPFAIVAANNGDAHVAVGDRRYAPPEIASMVLARMRETAEAYLGESVGEAVITVPAYFDDAQRQATKDAGRIAGLDVLRIVNEPTAAALAYGRAAEAAERLAVYDLGGGTFDVSILETGGGVFRVQSTSGDSFLGGDDFDRALVEEILRRFGERHPGVDLRGDKLALQRVVEAAEKAKLELSSAMETDINLPFLAAENGAPIHFESVVTRGELEALVEPLIQRTIAPCRRALADAGLAAKDIDVVLLVGGQTRMPRVQEVVTEFFGAAPSRGVNPDEVVAMGAAIQGGVLTGDVQEVLLLDVTPLSLGVETAGGVFTPVIARNTAIPARATKEFSTAVDNQDFVNVHVLQGEREMAEDNKSLAHFQLQGIPPAPRGVPRIEVALDIDANGCLTVSAQDLGTGAAQSVEVVPTIGLTEDDIERIIAEADASAELDKARRELAEVRSRAEALLHTSERALEEFGDVLSASEYEALKADLEGCRRAVERGEAEAVKAAVGRLETSSQRIGEILYEQAGGG